ncbi:MAG: GntR family transcriptional regulator [Deltaproteobacteria bacterium]|nr:GntR family transcriptional regulator [Deltaproteobacteria bacterium]
MRTETETKENLSALSVKPSHKGAAYLQLAGLIKRKIAEGEYQPGGRIPSESIISRSFGVAVMTVRQAINLLAGQGLLKRVHGRGTFVCGPDWTRAGFNLAGLLEKLGDQSGLEIKILKAGLSPAHPGAAAALNLKAGTPIVSLARLVSHRRRPLLLNKAFLASAPRTPVEEPEFGAASLSGLLAGQGGCKKALLKLEPCSLSPSEAVLLETAAPAFKICYTFYDYSDSPAGTGWFLTPMDSVDFSAKIGVWDD